MNANDYLKAAYHGLSFPHDFFQFRSFVQELEQRHGIDVNRCALQIQLGEVFDVFVDSFDPESYRPLTASRYPSDPPEFLTLIHGPSGGIHWGYYIENPAEPEYLIVSYAHNDPLELSISGLTLFEAMRGQLEASCKDNQAYLEIYGDAVYAEELAQLDLIRRELMQYDTGDRPETGDAYLETYEWSRRPGIPTRDGMGIMLNEALYRPLEHARDYLLSRFEPSEERVNADSRAALEALQQGHPGTALKLGKDLWCYPQYQAAGLRLLKSAYEALGRGLLLEFSNHCEPDDV